MRLFPPSLIKEPSPVQGVGRPTLASAPDTAHVSPDVLLSMQADAHIHACLTNRQNSVLCRPVVVTGGNTPGRARLQGFLPQMPAALSGALDALAMGWAVGEYIRPMPLAPLARVDGLGRGIIHHIRWHDVRRFGRTGAGELILRDGATPRVLPADAFLVYIHNPRWREAYGRSDLLPAVAAWRRKQRKTALWMAALERHGLPTPVATVPPHWNAARRQQLADALGGMAWDGALVVEEGVTIGLPLDKTAAATMGFAEAIEMENREISRAIGGQELTTQSSGAGGLGGKSLALAEVQERTAVMGYDALAGAVQAGVLDGLASALQADLPPEERATWGFG